ncbi:unnamed protein product [Rotaria sp. Silwood2]|nr:unnamed protein product [Rotaria sp. Silwood2]CAF3262420.1 unnamed protein product [Rotaria sp. Silwood2]CAF4195049.1 unnamed protein product [Rotaria sp. Silwood2]CAF4588738.1 unnamed protein product [Rotaria sp. Silwood2]CAF4638119.1 unnamed protein product [Rotaria sp. Silwood2]
MFKAHSLVCSAASALSIIFGVVLLIAGSVYIRDTSFLQSSWNEIYALSIYSVVIGILTIITAIGLSYVVNRKLPALTILFSVLILIIFVLAMVNLIILATNVGNLEDDSYKKTVDLFRNYSNSDLIVSSKGFFGKIQQTFGCCGVKNASDWINQLFNGSSTPDSCCHQIVPNCGYNALIAKDKIYLKGCADPIYFYLRTRFWALLTIDTILVILLFISAISGFISEQYIREQYQEM